MASKARLRTLAAFAGAVAASALVTDAIQRQLWANLALGGLAMAACLLFFMRSPASAPEDPPAASLVPGQNTEPLAALLDQVPMPLVRFSAARELQAVNRAARVLFRTDDLIIDPPAPFLDAVVRGEPGATGPLALFGRTYAIGISEISTAENTTRLISLTDIQSEVRVAEATALRDLLRVLSHEIMNSLTPVANLAGTARDYLAGETSSAAHSAREALDLLAQRASGLARFVEAYRAMARLPEPSRHPVDIGRLLQDVLWVFGQSLDRKTVSVELDLPPDSPSLDVDDTLLTQALLNLLTNAAEATATTPGPGRIRLSLAHDRNEVRISVADNGCGVPASLVEQIFHAFVTTKPSGTGTGLNLARQIALAHGGDLVFMGGEESWSAVFALILPVPPKLLGAG